MTAIVRRLVFTLVLILTRVAVHVQRITRGTLASITRIYRYARVRARGIGARIDLRAGETIVLQDPSGRTRATVGRVFVKAQMRTLVIALETLVDVLTLIILVVPSKSSRTREIPARETVLEKLHISRTSAMITAGDINALVRTIVLVLQTLVDVRASRSIVQQLVSDRTDASRPVFGILADVRAKILEAGAVPLFLAGRIVLHQDESRRTLARVRADDIKTDVGTSVRLVPALVHILTHRTILSESVTIMTDATIAARLVHALVLTAVRFIFVALVYV